MSMHLRPVLLASFAGLALAAPALAQNALDHNLRQGSNGQNEQVKDFQALQRFNNAVVTGRAGAGKSLEVPLGYTPLGEFHGTLATDSTYFALDRDAASAANVQRGIRSSDALSYQFAQATGKPVSGAISNLFSTARPSSPPPAYSVDTSLASGRSTAQFAITQAMLPTIIGYGTRDGENTVFTASPLRGIAGTALDANVQPDDYNNTTALTGLERSVVGLRAPNFNSPDLTNTNPLTNDPTNPRNPNDQRGPGGANGPNPALGPNGASGGNPPNGGGPVSSALGGPLDLRVDTSGTYNTILNTFKASVGTGPIEKPDANKPDGNKSNIPGARPTPPAAPVSAWQRELDAMKTELRVEPETIGPGKETPEDAAAAEAKEKARKEEQEKAIKSLQSMQAKAPKVDTLVARQLAVSDRYVSTMRQGNDALANENYFDAEALFAKALIMRPGDTMAQVGRVHAQLGAGLFASAGSNLRTLLGEHPELIPVRYEPQAMINRQRAPSLARALTAELAKPNSSLRAEAALLLAYIGYEYNNPAWVSNGLDALKANAKPGSNDDNLAVILGSIWTRTEGGESGAAPAAAPTAPAAQPAVPAQPVAAPAVDLTK